MAANKGTAFERQLQSIFDAYAVQGRAKIHKVDPPVRVIGKRKIFMQNDWLDFAGCWTEQGGRTLIIEAKRTDEARLPIGPAKGDGLTEKQLENCMKWEAAGAIVLIVWGHGHDIRVTTPAMACADSIMLERKSIRWADAHRVPQGFGYITHDLLAWAKALT